MHKPLNDWWWLRAERTRYASPLLCTLSMYLLRLLFGRRVYWLDSDYPKICEQSKKNPRSWWEMRCVFPKWMILAEYRFRDWKLRKFRRKAK